MVELEEEGQEDLELIQEIKRNLRSYTTAYRGWRQSGKEAYDFFAGNQWSAEDKSILDEERRPAVVFNRIARTINAVTGLELQNRQEVNYKPVTVDDTGVNDLMNCASKWTRSNCDAEDEESEAFQDTLICGIGATETLMDYSTDEDGMVIVERIDPFEFAVDPRSRKRNFDDAKWVARFKAYSKHEFESMYPDVELEGSDSDLWDDEADVSVKHADDEYKYDDNAEEQKTKGDTYTVVKYQYYKEECYYRVASQGQIVELTNDEYEAVSEQLQGMGIKAVKQTRRNYRQVIMCRNTILEQSEAPIKGFSIRFITGLRDRNQNIWFGLVELMKDPQRWANKWLSQIQFILNSNAKGGVMFETDAFANPKKAKAEWAKPNGWIELNEGAMAAGKVQPKQAPQYPDGIDRLLQQALTAINDVPGVNVEMLGIADRNQPGMIENSRKEAGVTILASFFDALRRYRKEQGRVLMQYIIEYISDGRLIRLDQPNAKYAPLLKDKLTAKYDILVDDSPTSPNMKEKVFGVVTSMLQVALQANIPIPPEILEYSPLPAALVEKWMKLIEEQKNNPDNAKKAEQADAMMGATIEKTQSEAAKNQAQALLNIAKTKKEGDPATYGSSPLDAMVEETKANASMFKANADIQKTQMQIKNDLIKSAMGNNFANGSVNNQQ
jgi:hypothetical protein